MHSHIESTGHSASESIAPSSSTGDIVGYAPSVGHDANGDQLDLREQLVNDRNVGLIHVVQLPLNLITSIHGIMIDVDLMLINPKFFGLDRFASPSEFYTKAIKPMLDRHATLAKAHVRCSGNGLHIILFFDQPVSLKSEADRQMWALRIEVLQGMLPSDPRCPGITAVTRPIGSINSKNNSMVFVLAEGEKVSALEIEFLCHDLIRGLFKTVATILFGPGPITPCPVCKQPKSRLGFLDRVGRCYLCGDVTLQMVYDCFFLPLNTKEG